ncbi:LOW QUALITY PROTEIN: inter-alpha-trypsin inhibitor heavy chain H5 [Amblyraja radiata]|uniref:LOW QUALITY PROTEIN: inter-alpha-trypsin inhibitor heavy chain H5 n=1 Tax=Amblyraja radiata TaxID=386614 RepID=UPI001401FAEA|nr:LOW QUALITY PROTEIN: inter-alpha-trypsin inhibitor heavy chain H5 [Amblyraja radiata]
MGALLLLATYYLTLGTGGAHADMDYNAISLPQPEGQQRPARQAIILPRPDSKPHMTDFIVKSTIFSRYAFTAVSCTMVNRALRAKDAVFKMQFPASAFISNFTMIIGNKVHQSEVSGKAMKSKGKEYSGKNGESEVEVFTVIANLPGRTKVLFLLTYEELLERRLGKYTHAISVRPNQIIPKLLVEIHLTENSGITFLEVAPLRDNNHSATGPPPPSTKINRDKTSAHVKFRPTVKQQVGIAENGALGDFILRYDVNRELGAGEIQVQNGYFVHYFAPKDLPAVPKNVVFVIDTSASMRGHKIKQTKDALFTILNDLRPIDHFNIINFSGRVKVWKHGGLVPVTRDTLQDARKYIYLMSPSGGTNINDAIETGSELLKGYIGRQDKTLRRVSLIIFVTDGRPTISVVQPRQILSNTRKAIEKRFCLFTLGIGRDVDYRLLERMALDNCGAMRRIREDSDAGAQLKGFFDEIGTPLLSDIRVDYSEDAVEYVTRRSFPNYFNGSELVVAGKLAKGAVNNSSSSNLHVAVRASSSDKQLTLEADVAIGGSPSTEQDKHGHSDMIQRAWSFLTIKELLRSRIQSDSNSDKDTLAGKARNLSLEYNFLTPLTSIRVAGTEQGAGAGEENLAAQDQRMQSLHSNSKPGRNSFGKNKKTVVVSKTSADGDPHFIADFPLSKLSVCFNIDGQPGDVLRLVSDHENSGVTVNGQLTGAPAPPGGHKKQRTYFSAITIIVSKPSRSYIEITAHRVILDGRDRFVLSCDRSIEVQSDGLLVAISARSQVAVTIQGHISFVFLLHQYKNPAPFQRDHLGFYILNSQGLSSSAHGLLGQFLHSRVQIVELFANASGSAGQRDRAAAGADGGVGIAGTAASLSIKDRLVPVVWKQRWIYNGMHQVDCWFAKNNAARLIDGSYKDYLASHLFDTTTSNANQL